MSEKVGTPVWVDYGSNDITACKDFYVGLFGWDLDPMGEDFGGYELLRRGETLVGGLMDVSGTTCPDGGPVPSEWGIFLAVDDLEARTATARAAGATVAMENMRVGELGRWTLLVDPTGAPVSMWEANELATFDRVEEPGSPVWFELVTKDFDAATRFYAEVFDFDITMQFEGEGFRYATNGPADTATSGICLAPWLGEDATGYWRVYFGVDGADAAAAKVTELGGRITDGPQDSPYGRVATVLDPEGATFQLCSMSEAVADAM